MLSSKIPNSSPPSSLWNNEALLFDQTPLNMKKSSASHLLLEKFQVFVIPLSERGGGGHYDGNKITKLIVMKVFSGCHKLQMIQRKKLSCKSYSCKYWKNSSVELSSHKGFFLYCKVTSNFGKNCTPEFSRWKHPPPEVWKKIVNTPCGLTPFNLVLGFPS